MNYYLVQIKKEKDEKTTRIFSKYIDFNNVL